MLILFLCILQTRTFKRLQVSTVFQSISTAIAIKILAKGVQKLYNWEDQVLENHLCLHKILLPLNICISIQDKTIKPKIHDHIDDTISTCSAQKQLFQLKSCYPPFENYSPGEQCFGLMIQVSLRAEHNLYLLLSLAIVRTIIY